MLNKARRRVRDEHKTEKFKEIESLKPSYPGIFWKLLKSVAGRRKKKTINKTAIDDKGKEVHGIEIKTVWKKAFKKLGASRENKFDKEMEIKVKEELEKIINEMR